MIYSATIFDGDQSDPDAWVAHEDFEWIIPPMVGDIVDPDHAHYGPMRVERRTIFPDAVHLWLNQRV